MVPCRLNGELIEQERVNDFKWHGSLQSFLPELLPGESHDVKMPIFFTSLGTFLLIYHVEQQETQDLSWQERTVWNSIDFIITE
jgi:hypothetical protein